MHQGTPIVRTFLSHQGTHVTFTMTELVFLSTDDDLDGRPLFGTLVSHQQGTHVTCTMTEHKHLWLAEHCGVLKLKSIRLYLIGG